MCLAEFLFLAWMVGNFEDMSARRVALYLLHELVSSLTVGGHDGAVPPSLPVRSQNDRIASRGMDE